jgi:hypothetical protein
MSLMLSGQLPHIRADDRSVLGREGNRKGDGPARGFWPQWRGPERTNVATDTALAPDWPKEGPALAWKADGLGQGVPSVAVAGGRVFTLGYREGKEYVTALDEATGQTLWQSPLGPAVKEFAGMRWLNQRTPTVDGDRLYAVSVHGVLVCLGVEKGQELWRRSYPKDFEGRSGHWGYCDYPLVDGDRLICTPGGKDATVVALDKRSGKVLWKCAVPGEDRGTEAAVVVANIAGVRQYVHQLPNGTVGIAAADGKFLWRYGATADSRGNVHTALVKGDRVLCSNGWGGRAALVRLECKGGVFEALELYRAKLPLDPWLGSSVLLGEHVYSANGFCFALETGKQVGRLEEARPRLTMCASGKYLLYRFPDNRILLAEAAPRGFRVKGEFRAPRSSREVTWSFPVLTGGRLYLRDQEVLLCYDLTARVKPRHREPDAIFVPTPQDVVEKMLELARVTKDDVVYDLGCGDGRIVVTAARKYGCKAVGYDLDAKCVRMARERVAQEKMGALVTIERQDLFTADLRPAGVITLYLGAKLNAKLVPQLAKLKPGTRIVSHAFDMPGVRPDRVVRVVSREDGVEHVLYLWTTPLKR